MAIKITVDGAYAAFTEKGKLTAGMVGSTLEASFNEAWDDLGVTCCFRCAGVEKDVLRVTGSDSFLIPKEVLLPWDHLEIGFYGSDTNGNVVIRTHYIDYGMIPEGADPSGDTTTSPDTPAVWAQLQARLDGKLVVKVSATEPQDKSVLWLDTTDNSGETGKAISFNFADSAYGFNSKGFDWDVSAVNDVYTVSNTFSISALRDEDGNAVPSVPHGYYGPFYKRLPVPIEPGTIEVAGSVTSGYGYVTGTGASGQFVRFGLYYPQDNTDGGSGYVRLIVRGTRAIPVTPDAQTLLPNPAYQTAVQQVVDSWMATRKGEDKNGQTVDKRHYWYGSNWTYENGAKNINRWYERHIDGKETNPIVYKEYCPSMECDTFALMCMTCVPYESSPYARRTVDGSDWYYRIKGGVNVGGTTLDFTTWNPWTDAHQDPLINDDGTTENLLSQLQNYTAKQYNRRVTTAGTEAWFFWDKKKIFTDMEKLVTGDLVFFRRYEPSDEKEWCDNIVHVGVITVEQVGDDQSAVVLNHVSGYTQDYDIDGIVTDTCLHRVLLKDFIARSGYSENQIYFARPYTVPYVAQNG